MEALVTQYRLTKVEYNVLGRAVTAYMSQVRTLRELTEEEAALEGLFSDDVDNLQDQDIRVALRTQQYSRLVAIVAKTIDMAGYRDMADYVLRSQNIDEVILRLLYPNP